MEEAAVKEAARAFVAEAGRYVAAQYAALAAARGDRPGVPPSVEVAYKDAGGTDPVTAVDRAVEARLAAYVAERFPGHAVLGEEEGAEPAGDAEWVWVVDPVDGTRNFVAGLPLFAVSVGVLRRGRPVVGAVALPAEGSVLHARRGGGAWRDGQPARVAAADALTPRLVGARGPDFREAFRADPALDPRLGEARWLGSTAYELAAVASGTLGYAAIGDVALWDCAGGVVLVAEAGGAVATSAGPDDAAGGGWAPLERFRAEDAAAGALRAWHGPLLAGPPAAVATLARHLTPAPRRVPPDRPPPSDSA